MKLKKSLLAAVIVATSMLTSVGVLASTTTPGIQIQQQKDDSIHVILKDMPLVAIHGIEIEVKADKNLPKDMTFESNIAGAFNMIKVDDTSFTLYMADDKAILDGATINVGTIKGLQDIDFNANARVKIIDETFGTTEWMDVSLEYIKNETDIPEPEVPSEPSEPSKPSDDSDESNNQSESSKPGESEQEPTQPINHFTDVEAHWAQKEINAMVEKGILKGYEDDTFRPNAQITRAEITAIIDRAFGFEESEVSGVFSDVAQGKWYTQSVANLYTRGIIKGRPDGTFGLTDNVTNEEVIVMIDRTLQSENVALDAQREYVTFTDEQAISSWAKESVNTLYRAMIISGTPEGKLLPREGVTRAQVAVIVHRILDSLEQ